MWNRGDIETPVSLFAASDHNVARLAHHIVATREPYIEQLTLDDEIVYVAQVPLKSVDWWVALVIPQANIDGQLADLERLAMLISGLLAAFVIAALLGVPLLRNRVLLRQLHAELRDRQQAERELRLSEERFRQLAENMREIVYLFAADFREVLYINPAYETVSGHSLTSVCRDARAWLNTVHLDDRARLEAVLATPEQRSHANIEYRICRADGEIRWLHMRNFPICNAAGEIYRIAGIAEDITARKQAELLQAEMHAQLEWRVAARTAELSQTNQRLQVEIGERDRAEREIRQLEERFRALFNQSPVGIAACDAAGHCVDANPALCKILGASAQVLSAYCLPELLAEPAPSASKTYFANLACGTAPPLLASEQQCRCLDGREIWVSLTLAPLTASATEQQPYVAIAVIEDITERKATEHRKEEFLAIASHELRTPLTTIQSSLELLSTGMTGSLDARGQQLLEFARLDTQRLSRLANKLLHYQRLRFGRAGVEWQWCATQALAENGCRAVTQQTPTAHSAIRLDLDPGLQVYGDSDALTRVLINLLENALKFSPPDGEVWLRINARPGCTQPSTVCFQVEDQGTGIEPSQIGRLFKPFERGSESSRTAQTGAGLGLAICQQIVQHHGSQLRVNSRLGQGSCFFFTLTPPTEPSELSESTGRSHYTSLIHETESVPDW
ncbi:MAG: PAS domain S-box protein [Spirulinaceae cyanobacterium RM2_2_10]|nr:PAS domain S-box protein [Spirulinaceae cyanobacterium RM2_2_10]